MNYQSLKQSVNSVLQTQAISSSYNFTNNDKIILGVLLFKIGEKILVNDSSYLGNLTPALKSYFSTYLNIVKTLKEKYTTYKEINKYINNHNILSFISIKYEYLNQIYYLYEHKKMKEQLSTKSYSCLMYDIENLSLEQDNILKNIHFKVIVPIVEYFIDFYGSSISDVFIEDKGVNFPGKVLYLSISNIDVNLIYNFLLNDYSNIRKYLYSFDIIENNTIELIIK